MPNPAAAKKLARDTRVLVKKKAIVKAGFSVRVVRRLSIDNVPGRSVQQFVPVISAPRLVASLANERFNSRRVQAKCRAGGADYVFLHHHRTEVVRAVFQRHLTDVGALRYP